MSLSSVLMKFSRRVMHVYLHVVIPEMIPVQCSVPQEPRRYFLLVQPLQKAGDHHLITELLIVYNLFLKSVERTENGFSIQVESRFRDRYIECSIII